MSSLSSRSMFEWKCKQGLGGSFVQAHLGGTYVLNLTMHSIVRHSSLYVLEDS